MLLPSNWQGAGSLAAGSGLSGGAPIASAMRVASGCWFGDPPVTGPRNVSVSGSAGCVSYAVNREVGPPFLNPQGQFLPRAHRRRHTATAPRGAGGSGGVATKLQAGQQPSGPSVSGGDRCVGRARVLRETPGLQRLRGRPGRGRVTSTPSFPPVLFCADWALWLPRWETLRPAGGRGAHSRVCPAGAQGIPSGWACGSG